jgi:Membrane carboxypeptidase/penicillin-binding protein
VSQTGATVAAPVWANYMRDIHLGLPYKNFSKPESGLVSVTVCAKSGQLPTEYCTDGTVNLMYLEGTQPTEVCTLHGPSVAPEPVSPPGPSIARPEESPIFQNR